MNKPKMILKDGKMLKHCVSCHITTLHKVLSKECNNRVWSYYIECIKCNSRRIINSPLDATMDFSLDGVNGVANTFTDNRGIIRCLTCHWVLCRC